MKDAWQSGDPYDLYMGRWSRLVAERFVDWLSPAAELRWLDVGCGTGAVYVWDYAGKMDFLNQFWDAAVELDPNAAALHEGRRFPDSNAACLTELFVRAGLSRVEAHPIEIVTRFSGFQDYWQPFLGGQGPAPTYVSKLTEPQRMRLEEALAERLPVAGDGSILLSARAWATRGLVPS